MRLIPAHAGKTEAAIQAGADTAAHPRSRGENDVPVIVQSSYPGSSPLTRGKRNTPQSAGRVARLIPAHAGKTV